MKKKDFDKELYKDRKCFQCGKKGHPKSHCQNLSKDKDDESVKSSKVSRSISDLKSQLKGIKKSFAQLESKFQDAKSDESGESMFQYNFWSQVETQQVNNPQVSVEGLVMKQSTDSKLSLKDVILLDSQSTVSVFCNADYVSDI